MTTIIDCKKPASQGSPEAERLIARARRLEASADRAFVRLMNGEVRSASGAASVQAKADEAWADVRFGIERGDEVEARECGFSV